jgi:hypothetical protein
VLESQRAEMSKDVESFARQINLQVVARIAGTLRQTDRSGTLVGFGEMSAAAGDAFAELLSTCEGPLPLPCFQPCVLRCVVACPAPPSGLS